MTLRFCLIRSHSLGRNNVTQVFNGFFDKTNILKICNNIFVLLMRRKLTKVVVNGNLNQKCKLKYHQKKKDDKFWKKGF